MFKTNDGIELQNVSGSCPLNFPNILLSLGNSITYESRIAISSSLYDHIYPKKSIAHDNKKMPGIGSIFFWL